MYPWISWRLAGKEWFYRPLDAVNAGADTWSVNVTIGNVSQVGQGFTFVPFLVTQDVNDFLLYERKLIGGDGHNETFPPNAQQFAEAAVVRGASNCS